MRAYWPGMYEAVTQHVAACHECAFAKKPHGKEGTTVSPEVATRPFHTVYCDVLTLPKSDPVGPFHLRYSKLIIWADCLTRWVESTPIPGEPDAGEVGSV